MKKLVTALALCAAVSAYAAVESANIVGYNTLTMPAGKFISLAFNFEKTGVTGTGITVGDLVANPGFQLNDKLMIAFYDGPTFKYTTYVYRDATWLSDFEVAGDPGWYSLAAVYAGTNKMSSGSAVWFQGVTEKSVTVAGQVNNTASTAFAAFPANKYTMIGSAYPVGFEPNKAGTIWSGATSGDKLMVPFYNLGLFQYTTYFYRDATWLAAFEVEGAPGWYTTSNVPAGVIANAGYGFWVYPQNTLTLTQPSPL